MSDPSVPFSRLREQRSRKKCPDKQISAQDLWPSIRLHGIKLRGISLPFKLHGIKLQGTRLFNIKPHGIMPHGAKLLSRDLFLPIKVANPRITNPGTLKSHRRCRMINIARSYLFECRA
jgi:hypothetical protein